MARKKELQKCTVIARNSSGVLIIHPDGTEEGSVTISAKRHAMAVEGINQLRREAARKGA